ncbi:metallophosphoesterase [Urechidicola croceus]|uniref:Phosphohydrolase n=1 Tax=Urechidicola croceus TaxID=1850246 RepID=A0A1D8P7Y4_9FLAO|nr:metallophosphoesterase [Urechidicola croceus]AOW20682.1 phosphohydrolase [Urechidicola croceus]
MRPFSLFSIILICIAVLLVDILAFYWLQSITQLITSTFLQKFINIIFWVFTIGLILSIIILKLRLDNIDPKRKQILISSLYGLTISSFVPKLIFVIIISTLYFSNYLFSEKQSLIIIPLIGLFSGFLPFFMIIYGIFRTLYRFKIHTHSIKIPTLPKSFNGLRIVHISDIHLGSFNFRYHILDKAIATINNLNPDFIFFTGDLVNNYAWELKGWDKVLKKLSASKGKFSILGNHDYGDYSQWKSKEEKESNFQLIKAFHKKIGFKLLLNQSDVIEINTDKIAIIGVENWGKPPFKQYGNLEKSLKLVNNIPFKILLSHDPSHWKAKVLNKTDIAITFSGHTHGMQAGINLKNKKWSPIKYKYEHWAGLYKENNQYLHVNRGLGWLGFPGRLGMRPEITLIELMN